MNRNPKSIGAAPPAPIPTSIPGAGAASRAPEALIFENDAGSWRPVWLAGLICLALTFWMASGVLMPADDAEPEAPDTQAASLVSVATRVSEAETITLFFVGEGQASPDRETVLLAEMSGRVSDVYIAKGQMLSEGAVIAQIDPAQRMADLTRATEELTRAVREFENAETLLKRGASTSDRVSQARAALASAKAGVSSARQGVAQTELLAPFEGRLEALSIDPGEYVQEGAELARVVDNTPLTVSVRVPQQMRGKLRVGAPASVQFITGENRAGEIVFLGSNADADTRTFLAEISVPNEGGEIPAGISAQLRVPTGQVTAHFLSPAILSLGPGGAFGVKTLDAADRVVFTPVEIAQTKVDGIWVTGLPPKARIITIGQGFVTVGEQVSPTEDAQPDSEAPE